MWNITKVNYCVVLIGVAGEVYVPLWVKKGTLKFPPDESPVIMVGPGTGVAPFRSALQERTAQGKNGEIFTFLTSSLTSHHFTTLTF